MIRTFIKNRFLYFFVDFLLVTFSFCLAYYLSYRVFSEDGYILKFFYIREYVVAFLLWFCFIVISFKTRHLYITDRRLSISGEALKVISTITYSSILIGALVFFAKFQFFSRAVFINSYIFIMIFLVSFRIIKRVVLKRLIKKGFHNINILIIGVDSSASQVLKDIKRNSSWGFKVVGFLDDNNLEEIDEVPVLGKISEFEIVAKKFFIDEVIVTMSVYEKKIPQLIKQAKKMRLGIRLLPSNFGGSLNPTSITYLGSIPLLNYGEKNYYISGFVIKRIIDFLVSFILMILLSPMLLIIAASIKITSRGPIFYIKPRMGIKGKEFKFYKFRSMCKNADTVKDGLRHRNESKGNIIFKIKDDPRTTIIGRFLRKHSLDELPQLYNVLKGDMSLVGPRPFPIDESRKVSYKHLPRLSIRPGITGLSQVKGRSDLSFYQWVKWDLWYINNWSFNLDLQILLWTIPVVVKGKGAY